MIALFGGFDILSQVLFVVKSFFVSFSGNPQNGAILPLAQG
jgi:hypothetical protein